MAMVATCRHFKERWDRASDSCTHLIPCLADPGRRSSMGMKWALVMLHLTYLSVILFLDRDLIERTKKYPCYAALYLLLFVATIAQYFFTSGSSPGYVIDAKRSYDETSFMFVNSSVISKQPASGSVVITVDESQLLRDHKKSHASWENLIMDMYPIGSSTRNWTCTYCSVLQPPRSKHCHDCDKCVLQFDHHCVWLGTCIGQGNHCRFWWYIFEETALCLWTGVLYVVYLKTHIFKAWWIIAIVVFILITLSISLIFLLLLLIFHCYLVLTNQTTYELVRRKRIPYLREIPDRVYPFSKGIKRNVYNFCCNYKSSIYNIEPLPTAAEYEAMSAPYSCFHIITCRCC